jgi:hypothetical protein
LTGDVQDASAAASSAQRKPVTASFAEKVNCAVVAVVSTGGPARLITGAVVSGGGAIVQACVALPAFPAASVASTRNECWPRARPERFTGETHEASGAVSSAQRKPVTASFAENVSCAVVEEV